MITMIGNLYRRVRFALRSRATREAEERAYAARFGPHLRVETEREVPSPIFVAAICGVKKLRHVPVDERAWSADERTRDRLVRFAIYHHFRQYPHGVPAFGKIKGYSLLLRPENGRDIGLAYDVHGNRIGPCAVERLGEARIEGFHLGG